MHYAITVFWVHTVWRSANEHPRLLAIQQINEEKTSVLILFVQRPLPGQAHRECISPDRADERKLVHTTYHKGVETVTPSSTYLYIPFTSTFNVEAHVHQSSPSFLNSVWVCVFIAFWNGRLMRNRDGYCFFCAALWANLEAVLYNYNITWFRIK